MRSCTVVISRSSEGGAGRRAFEDDVIARVKGHAKVLVVPSVYWMPDGHEALAALAEVSGDLVYASWLHPRAAYWLLRARGIEGEQASDDKTCGCADSDRCPRTLRTFKLDALGSPQACAAALLKAAGETAKPALREFKGDPEPRWYPVLDVSACVACGQCHDFCLFGVYSLDEENRPVASSPDRCKPGCPACARVCPEGAILFPEYAADEGIAGAPGKRPAAAPVDVEAFFAKSKGPCPLCGCSCDCERSTDGTAPPGKTACPACGCICDSPGPCACEGDLVVHGAADAPAEDPRDPRGQRDDLDDLIDALDQLDV